MNVTTINDEVKDEPGTVHILSDVITVSTGSGEISINELQLEGKRRMNSRDFLNGHQIEDGTILR